MSVERPDPCGNLYRKGEHHGRRDSQDLLPLLPCQLRDGSRCRRRKGGGSARRSAGPGLWRLHLHEGPRAAGFAQFRKPAASQPRAQCRGRVRLHPHARGPRPCGKRAAPDHRHPWPPFGGGVHGIGRVPELGRHGGLAVLCAGRGQPQFLHLGDARSARQGLHHRALRQVDGGAEHLLRKRRRAVHRQQPDRIALCAGRRGAALQPLAPHPRPEGEGHEADRRRPARKRRGAAGRHLPPREAGRGSGDAGRHAQRDHFRRAV